MSAVKTTLLWVTYSVLAILYAVVVIFAGILIWGLLVAAWRLFA